MNAWISIGTKAINLNAVLYIERISASTVAVHGLGEILTIEGSEVEALLARLERDGLNLDAAMKPGRP